MSSSPISRTNRLDSDTPAGVDIQVRITMPDLSPLDGRVVESSLSGKRSRRWQLDKLLELNELCIVNDWGLEAWVE